jgi:hypothetical protein
VIYIAVSLLQQLSLAYEAKDIRILPSIFRLIEQTRLIKLDLLSNNSYNSFTLFDQLTHIRHEKLVALAYKQIKCTKDIFIVYLQHGHMKEKLELCKYKRFY